MPKICIKSRDLIEEIAQHPFTQKTAVISITDVDWSFAELKNQPNYLLQLAFDDVDNDIFWGTTGTRESIERKYHMITDEQAVQIVDFYNSVRDSVDVLICQCEHGQSRSAAIAAAILEYESRNGIDIFADDNYYPNKVVFKKILNELKGGISK